MHKSTLPLLAFLSVTLPLADVRASTLVYESFSYGESNIANINGTAATGEGLQGNWTATNTATGGGTATSAYVATGLSFGSNFATTSGGALLQSTKYSGGTNSTIASARLNVTTTGTLWSSYLVSYSTLSNGTQGSGVAQQAIGNAANPTTTTLGSAILSNTTTSTWSMTGKFDATGTGGSQTATFALNTTYLVLSRFTGVGTNTGTAQSWMMTLAQYDNWVAAGALESNLSTFAPSPFTVSDSGSSGSAINFDANGYAIFKAQAVSTNNAQLVATFDELRYGTGIPDVGVIPEPSSVTLLGLGAGALAFSRRRRNR